MEKIKNHLIEESQKINFSFKKLSSFHTNNFVNGFNSQEEIINTIDENGEVIKRKKDLEICGCIGIGNKLFFFNNRRNKHLNKKNIQRNIYKKY